MTNDIWAVTVTRNGEEILTIESNYLCGKADLTDNDIDCIRNCGEHLLGFAGPADGEFPFRADAEF